MSVLSHGNQGKVLMFLDKIYMRIYLKLRAYYFNASNSTRWLEIPLEQNLSSTKLIHADRLL